MDCSYCKEKDIEDDAKYCTNCGVLLKNKNKFLAVILNILFIGAGHYYVSNTKKSFVFFPMIIIVVYSLYLISSYIEIGYFSFLAFIIPIMIYIFSIYDVLKLIKNNKSCENRSNGLFVYIPIYIGLIFIIYQYSPVKRYVIPSNSMSHTILINDSIIVNGFNKNANRGDIFAFKYPKNNSIIYAKRIVAKGGDVIALKDKHLFFYPKEGNEYVQNNYPQENIINVGGKLWVIDPYKNYNTGIHNDSSVINNGLNPIELFDMMPIKVPKNEYFMMGDNRDHSNDSRFWGTVKQEELIGKISSIFINLDKLDRSGTLIK